MLAMAGGDGLMDDARAPRIDFRDGPLRSGSIVVLEVG
jgi:hypothetical protein